jgi:hypothetical protein
MRYMYMVIAVAIIILGVPAMFLLFRWFEICAKWIGVTP